MYSMELLGGSFFVFFRKISGEAFPPLPVLWSWRLCSAGYECYFPEGLKEVSLFVDTGRTRIGYVVIDLLRATGRVADSHLTVCLAWGC